MHGLTVPAVAEIAVAFSSNPQLSRPDIVTLRDDRRMIAPDHIVPVVRKALLRRYGPPLRRRLDARSRLLTTLRLRGLNHRATRRRGPLPAAVGDAAVERDAHTKVDEVRTLWRHRGSRSTVGSLSIKHQTGAPVMSSSPYVPSSGGGVSPDSPLTYYDDDDPHGQGLVTFAGVMLMIAAVLNTLYGIAAIDNANVFVHNARYVFGDLNTWGWFLVALGVLQFFAALAIWRGAPWGRWFGVGCASANAILQTLWIPAYPILALTILPLDIIAIYGLLAYGGRRRAVRAARTRG